VRHLALNFLQVETSPFVGSEIAVACRPYYSVRHAIKRIEVNRVIFCRYTHRRTSLNRGKWQRTEIKPGFHYPSWRTELTARVDGWPVSITRVDHRATQPTCVHDLRLRRLIWQWCLNKNRTCVMYCVWNGCHTCWLTLLNNSWVCSLQPMLQ